jgi:hypothetical protein
MTTKNNFKKKIGNYYLTDYLDKGSFGLVYKGTRENSDETIAIKMIGVS